MGQEGHSKEHHFWKRDEEKGSLTSQADLELPRWQGLSLNSWLSISRVLQLQVCIAMFSLLVAKDWTQARQVLYQLSQISRPETGVMSDHHLDLNAGDLWDF